MSSSFRVESVRKPVSVRANAAETWAVATSTAELRAYTNSLDVVAISAAPLATVHVNSPASSSCTGSISSMMRPLLNVLL